MLKDASQNLLHSSLLNVTGQMVLSGTSKT